jgi:hypothetical protein
MEDQLRAYLSTIWGEAAGCAPATHRAIASVILNRVGQREWKSLKTPLRVIAVSGFDAFTRQNDPYREAWSYFGGGRGGMRLDLEEMEDEVRPLLESFLINPQAPRPTDAQLYYSPKAQAALREAAIKQGQPHLYPARPRWAFDLLEEVRVLGTERDDFRFYRYRVPA